MENKHVGHMLIGISALIIVMVFMFRNTLIDFVDSSCTLAHGEDYCPMVDTISQQTYLSLGIVGILVVVGFVLIFSKPQIQTIVKTIEKKPEKKVVNVSDLKDEEKRVFELVRENGAIFQADLIEKTGFGKAKMTRILDRLEGRGFVERKRRGMTNVVVLKSS